MNKTQKIVLIIVVVVVVLAAAFLAFGAFVGNQLYTQLNQQSQEIESRQGAITYNNELVEKREALFDRLNTLIFTIDNSTNLEEVKADIQTYEDSIQEIQNYLDSTETVDKVQKLKQGNQEFVNIAEQIAAQAKEYVELAEQEADFTPAISQLNEQIEALNQKNQKLNNLVDELNDL
jgi:cell division protein FtsB